MVGKRLLTFVLFAIGSISWIHSQTADITEGCVPVEVNFTSTELSEHYWEFGDNATSNLQNPIHVYTTAGNYTAILYEGVNGEKIGEIELTIYADPIITINADVINDCNPSQIQFSADITIDPNIQILSYLWSFGDGGSSTDTNPIYNYSNAGNYSIYLAIETSIPECDKTEVLQNIDVEKGINAVFILNKSSSCDVPGIFTITNISDQDDDFDYSWTFGDGTTFDGFDPDQVTYDEEGVYDIILTVTDENDCEITYKRTVTVGPPPFDLTIPAIQCINQEVTIINNTQASSFDWTFGPDATISTSTDKNPEVEFWSGGPKVITLEVENSAGCVNDTTIFITIDDPEIEIFTDPDTLSCEDPFTMEIKGSNLNFTSYNWVVNGESFSGSTFNYFHECPPRDSFYLNTQDTFAISLEATNENGCVVETVDTVFRDKVVSHFTVDKSRGCAPLTVTFYDSSFSKEEIISWKYIYSNGDEEEYFDYENHTYTFTETGEYLVQLIIENENGCIDTTGGSYILVGEQIATEYEIDKTEICLGDTISVDILNDDPRINTWHFNTDDNRVNHCWKDQSGSHVFVHSPGSYPLTITTEYNGCYWDETINDAIVVNGAKANIGYMTNCENLYSVMFDSKSLGNASLIWEIDEKEFTEEEFSYTFENKGVKKIILTANDPNSTCPATVDSVEVHIVDPEAKFTIDSLVCDNLQYTLDASASIDVDTRCHGGYLWYLPDYPRPRELSADSVLTTFSQRGENDVTLIVEDINGCFDTLTQTTTSFGIDPAFEISDSLICLPTTVDFLDTSESDTTLVSWVWNFGSENQNTSYTFDNSASDTIVVSLKVEDELGCADSVFDSIFIYNVVTDISIDIGPNICIGEEITFTGKDFEEQGSNVDFDWDFDSFGSGNQQVENIQFDESGNFWIYLEVEEQSSGCKGLDSIQVNVYDFPEADFVTPFDDQETICYPAIIEFENTSVSGPGTSYFWDFDNGRFSFFKDPVESLEKGTFDVTIIANLPFGCADTITKSYTLVGPEGDMIVDQTAICTGETVTFSAENLVDVTSFIWDFGDGTTDEMNNPVEHTYNFNPPSGEVKADLVLKSEETGCEIIYTKFITINELNADFILQDNSHCEGLAIFENLSTGDFDNVFWDFGNGQTSTEFNPEITYGDLGTYTVTLEVSDNEDICFHSVQREIELDEVEEYFLIPNVFSPNNDGNNDYFNVYIKPEYEDVASILTFKVYNRWGNLVYDNSNPDSGWDGQYNNRFAPTEVYAYYIEVEIINCNNKVQKGNVQIVR